MQASPALARHLRRRPPAWRTRSGALTLSLGVHGALVAAGLWFGFDLPGRGPQRSPVEVAILPAPVLESLLQREIRPLPPVEEREVEEPVLVEAPPETEPQVEVPLTWNWERRRTVAPRGFRELPRPAAAAAEAAPALALALAPTPLPPPASAPEPARASVASGVFVAAKPLPGACPVPAYPAGARRRGIEGVVKLGVSIAEDGLPVSVEVEVSSGHAILDEAAVEAVRRWRFQPAQQGGKAVSDHMVVPVRFRLEA